MLQNSLPVLPRQLIDHGIMLLERIETSGGVKVGPRTIVFAASVA